MGFRLKVAVGLVVALAASACKPKPPKFETIQLDRGAIVARVTATGTLSALVTVQVGSQVSGIIAKLHADFNSKVKKGDLLAELDPTPFQAQVEQHTDNVPVLDPVANKAWVNGIGAMQIENLRGDIGAHHRDVSADEIGRRRQDVGRRRSGGAS